MPPMSAMPPESSPGSTGLDDPRLRPDDHRPEDEPPDEPDPDWPDDWPDHSLISPPSRPGQSSWPGTPPPPARGGGGGIPGRRALALVVVAVVALATGAGVALILMKGTSSGPSSPLSSPPSAAAPSFGAPGSNGNGGALPGSGGSGTIQMFVGGKVLEVSGTSITIGGPGHTVTAAVTSSTRVTGRVSSIRAVKVGDLVTAQITRSGGKATVTAIQDPAQLPPGPSLP